MCKQKDTLSMMIKKELNNRTSSKILKIGMWHVLVVAVSFVGLIIYRIPFVAEEERTAEAVARIQSQHLTLKDVTGENLPPTPEPILVGATVEGIDANQNGIRDDVELAIFERYPNDIKIRAALLQYAMALQLELTEVFNSETWVAVTQKISRGFGCIYDSIDVNNLNFTLNKIKEIEIIVRNSAERKNHYQNLDEFQTTFTITKENDCDITISN